MSQGAFLEEAGRVAHEQTQAITIGLQSRWEEDFSEDWLPPEALRKPEQAWELVLGQERRVWCLSWLIGEELPWRQLSG